MSMAQSAPPPGGIWSDALAADRVAKAIAEARLLIDEARVLQRRSAVVRQRSVDLHDAWHPRAPINASLAPEAPAVA